MDWKFLHSGNVCPKTTLNYNYCMVLYSSCHSTNYTIYCLIIHPLVQLFHGYVLQLLFHQLHHLLLNHSSISRIIARFYCLIIHPSKYLHIICLNMQTLSNVVHQIIVVRWQVLSISMNLFITHLILISFNQIYLNICVK